MLRYIFILLTTEDYLILQLDFTHKGKLRGSLCSWNPGVPTILDEINWAVIFYGAI